MVGGAVVWMSHHPTLYKLVPDAAVGPTRQCLRRHGGLRGMLSGLLSRKWYRQRIARQERRTLPGYMLHIVARKRYIEAAVRRAFAQEFSQVIILGAGYDTLALRLHEEFPKATFIEVDHPGTQRVKLAAALGQKLPSPNLAAVAADLSKPGLFDALVACPIFRPGADTVFVAEGLLMYLSPDAVSALLDQLREGVSAPAPTYASKPGDKSARAERTATDPARSAAVAAARPAAGPGARRGRVRLIFSFLEILEETGQPGFPDTPEKFDRWLARREPFGWGISRNAVGEFLARHGFAAAEVAGAQTLRQRVLQGVPETEPLAQGEFLCIADRD